MTHLKRLAVFFLHLGATLAVQLSLLHLVLKENDPSLGTALVHALPAVGACLLDMVFSCLLMRGQCLGRFASMALHFWDIVLACPLLVLGFFGLLSGGYGSMFGVCVLLLDLLLVIERSTVFALFDPARRKK